MRGGAVPQSTNPAGNSTGPSSGDGPCDGAGTFEQSLAELESIVHDLEDGQIGLAEALTRYEQGVRHLKYCYALLQQAERKIELLTGVAEDGTAITTPLPADADSLEESAGRRRRRSTTAPRERDIDGPGQGF